MGTDQVHGAQDTQVRGAEWAARRNLTAFFPSNIAAANSPFMMSQPNMDVFVKSMEWGTAVRWCRSPTVCSGAAMWMFGTG